VNKCKKKKKKKSKKKKKKKYIIQKLWPIEKFK